MEEVITSWRKKKASADEGGSLERKKKKRTSKLAEVITTSFQPFRLLRLRLVLT